MEIAAAVAIPIFFLRHQRDLRDRRIVEMIENCRCDVLIQQPVVFQMKDEIGFCGAPNAFYGGGEAGRFRSKYGRVRKIFV